MHDTDPAGREVLTRILGSVVAVSFDKPILDIVSNPHLSALSRLGVPSIVWVTKERQLPNECCPGPHHDQGAGTPPGFPRYIDVHTCRFQFQHSSTCLYCPVFSCTSLYLYVLACT